MKIYIAPRTKTAVIIAVLLFLFGGMLLSTGEGFVGGFKIFLGKFEHLLRGNIF